MKPKNAISILTLTLILANGYAQGTLQPLHITFDGPPVIAPGIAIGVQQYFESGMLFKPIGPIGPGNTFTRVEPGGPSGQAENGTAYLRVALT